MSWATIVDCGDVRMTPLDNNIALKQLDKAHQVSKPKPHQANTPTNKVTDRLGTAGFDAI